MTPESTPSQMRASLFDALAEDEAMRNTKRTGIETFRSDLELSPMDELPIAREEIQDEHD